MKTCAYEVDSNGIAVMTINNPPLNALSSAVLADIKSTVEGIISDPKARVAIITGAGKAFVAGADIRELAAIDDVELSRKLIDTGQGVFNIIENSDKPFIAAINGFALGGGMELALACHIRIADETAQMGLPEIKLGLIPGYGGTQRTPRTIGVAKALELVLTGNFISANDALLCNLINHVSPKGEVLQKAMEIALNIASKGRPAVKAAMKAVREGMQMALHDGLKLEKNKFVKLCSTENKNEGIRAFLEKRDPVPKDN